MNALEQSNILISNDYFLYYMAIKSSLDLFFKKYNAITPRSLSFMSGHDCKNRNIYQILSGSENVANISNRIQVYQISLVLLYKISDDWFTNPFTVKNNVIIMSINRIDVKISTYDNNFRENLNKTFRLEHWT